MGGNVDIDLNEDDDDEGDNEASQHHRRVNNNENNNEEQNFYRDFTIKLGSSSHTRQKRATNLFSSENEEANECKQINLNCFITALKFQHSLLNLAKTICFKFEMDLKTRCDLLKLFNLTYLISIKLDRFLSFKILLSKIFYLNYENNLANFVSLTKCAYLCINNFYFEYVLNETSRFSANFELTSFVDVESQLDGILSQNGEHNEVKSLLEKYVALFIFHFSKCYLHLNEKAHNFKLDDVYLNNLMDKYDNKEACENMEINEEVIELFKIHKEHNKALTMLNLTKMTQSTLSKSPSSVVGCRGGGGGNDENEANNSNLAYIRKDFRFRYQIWSYKMINYFLNYFNKNSLVQKLSTQSCKNIAQLIVVFNSCSSYCQCSVVVQDENISKFNKQSVKATSVKLLSSILNSIKTNATTAVASVDN